MTLFYCYPTLLVLLISLVAMWTTAYRLPQGSSRSSRTVLLTRLFGGGKNRDGLGKPKGYSDANLRYVLEQHTRSGLPDRTRPFLVLGIESSCDDTGAAVVRSDGTILSNVVYSQYEIHERFGGIVPRYYLSWSSQLSRSSSPQAHQRLPLWNLSPSLAMEAHKTNIDKAVAEAVAQAGLNRYVAALPRPAAYQPT